MPRYLRFLGLAAMLALFNGCATPESLVMRPATSPEGWNGNAFYRNEIIAAEEFVTGRNGYQTDVWRFYDGYGRLYVEEFDTLGNGQRNVRRSYNKDGVLVVVEEDTTGDGIYDNVVNYNKEKKTATKPVNVAARQTVKPVKKVKTPKTPKVPQSANKTRVPKTPRQNQTYIAPPPSVTTPPAPTQYVPPAPPANNNMSGENWIRPLNTQPVSGTATTDANTRVVPGPVFRHPSDGLDD